MSPLAVVLDSTRRAVVLAALQPGANKAAIAREYGVSREYVSRQAVKALSDPEGVLKEAEEELAFRRRVLELVSS